MMRSTFLSFGAVWLLIAAPGMAQDPMREIKEIADAVEQQMQEIDRLLLESSKRNQGRQKPREMLQQASERGAEVEQRIDELIEKLTEMKNQGGSGSGDGKQEKPGDKPQGQGGQQGGQQGTRRENQTPDFVQQPQQGADPNGQQPDQKPGGGQPQLGQDSKQKPENRPAHDPPQSETGPGQRGEGDETWGNLPDYVNFLKHRGSSPKVPEKYRKYWEAYLKNRQDGDRK
jgi:hypothetical protein